MPSVVLFRLVLAVTACCLLAGVLVTILADPPAWKLPEWGYRLLRWLRGNKGRGL